MGEDIAQFCGQMVSNGNVSSVNDLLKNIYATGY